MEYKRTTVQEVQRPAGQLAATLDGHRDPGPVDLCQLVQSRFFKKEKGSRKQQSLFIEREVLEKLEGMELKDKHFIVNFALARLFSEVDTIKVGLILKPVESDRA